ncbi:uncharacterized protein LOC134844036 [Symsagittifera roscoffensis]|uniref:uncharacterized protein LOC134844036 n=1 Tax=Symsagittifera roscoffensis TaxID=84072 RepID=UPI00307CB259
MSDAVEMLSPPITILRKDPLQIAIEEIRASRLEEKGGRTSEERIQNNARNGEDELNYLAAVYHYERAINFISMSLPKIQLVDNRIKLDKKLRELNKKITVLTAQHDERERKRFEARMKEEAKTKYSVIGPVDSLNTETRAFFKSTIEEKTFPFDPELVQLFLTPYMEESKRGIYDDGDESEDETDDATGEKMNKSERKRDKIFDPVLIYGPKQVGKSHLVKTVLPFELPGVTFVSVSAEDLSIYGPILFKYAFSFARQHMPAAVVLEDMHHQVYEGDDNANNEIHETMRAFILNSTDIQIIGICSSPWSLGSEQLQIFPRKKMLEYPTVEQTKMFLEKRFQKMSHSLSSNAFDLLTQEIDMLDWGAKEHLQFIDSCHTKCEELELECEQVKQDHAQATEEEIESMLRPHLFTLGIAKSIMKTVQENRGEIEDRFKILKKFNDFAKQYPDEVI